MRVTSLFLVYSLLVLLCVWPIEVLHAQDDFESLIEQGYEHYKNENYSSAIAAFNAAEKLDKSDPELYYLRGVCYSLLNKYQEASADYDRALRLKPDYAEVYFEKGYLSFQQQDLKAALLYFDQAIKVQPEYGEAYLNRGSIKCMLDDKQGAEADWRKAESLGFKVPEKNC
jgi:tetratricopeptide (TPR) repeat protein